MPSSDHTSGRYRYRTSAGRKRPLPIPPGPFRDIDEIIVANKQSGHHFFDDDTLRFFGSRIDDELKGGRFFVTSERSGFDHNSPRRYTVRVALELGETTDLGEFGEFDTLRQARRAAEKAAAGEFVVRFDPYTAKPSEQNPDAYAWRVYSEAVDLPIGNRTTKADCDRLAALLNRERRAREKRAR